MQRSISVIGKTLVLLAVLTISRVFPAVREDERRDPGLQTRANEHELMREVRHQLRRSTRDTFDVIGFSVGFSANRATVTLLGQVAEPAAKDDAQMAVERIEGVAEVVNDIEVLALSPNSARIRRDVFRAIYDDSELAARYGYSFLPVIHIVVGDGQVRLEGFVGSELDRNRILVLASEVPGAFKIIDDLQVERK